MAGSSRTTPPPPRRPAPTSWSPGPRSSSRPTMRRRSARSAARESGARIRIIDRMKDGLAAAGLLTLSNLFMTVAWYGHLRFTRAPLLLAILASWGIALFEYFLQVPANRLGYRVLSAYQLKIMQEAITLIVFMAFAAVWLGEGLQARYVVSFALVLCAVVIAFR